MRKIAAVLSCISLPLGGLLFAVPAHAAGACAPTMVLSNLVLSEPGIATYDVTVTASPADDTPGGCFGDATYRIDDLTSGVPAGESRTVSNRMIMACGHQSVGTVQQGGVTATSNALTIGFLPPYKPTAPSLVTAQAYSLTASWTSNADICHPVTSYQLISGLGGGSVTTTATQATLANLNPATTYNLAVVAFNDYGSNTGDTRSMATLAAPKKTASAPQNLTASSVQTTSVHLAWAPPVSTGTSPITGYQVSLNGRVVTTVAGTAADLNGLTPNTGYSASLVALNADGAGDAATVGFRTASAVAPTRVPGTVVNLRVSAKSATSMVLDWNAPVSDGGSAVTGYLVLNQTTGERRSFGAGTTETAFALQPATTYVFVVTAINANGAGPAATTSATTDPAGAPDKAEQTIVADPHAGKAWKSGKAHYVGAVRSSAGIKVKWTARGKWVSSFTITRKGSQVLMTVKLKKGAPKAADVTIDATAAGNAQFDPAHVANGVRVYR